MSEYVETTSLLWVCHCKRHQYKPKSISICNRCGFERDTSPDAEVDAVVKASTLISPTFVWSYNPPESDGKTPARVYSCAWSSTNVGEFYHVQAAAPGVGSQTWLVTRKDLSGVWGVEVKNTIRVLEPEAFR